MIYIRKNEKLMPNFKKPITALKGVGHIVRSLGMTEKSKWRTIKERKFKREGDIEILMAETKKHDRASEKTGRKLL